ncbi:MAG TPA: EYxxD motif small membrane protein [Bacillota bacterium]|nr:EYxxD motif small membrane protein [Bacillota bacterium]
MISASLIKYAWNHAFVWISIVAAIVLIGYLWFTFNKKTGRYKS